MSKKKKSLGVLLAICFVASIGVSIVMINHFWNRMIVPSINTVVKVDGTDYEIKNTKAEGLIFYVKGGKDRLLKNNEYNIVLQTEAPELTEVVKDAEEVVIEIDYTKKIKYKKYFSIGLDSKTGLDVNGNDYVKEYTNKKPLPEGEKSRLAIKTSTLFVLYNQED